MFVSRLNLIVLLHASQTAMLRDVVRRYEEIAETSGCVISFEMRSRLSYEYVWYV